MDMRNGMVNCTTRPPVADAPRTDGWTALDTMRGDGKALGWHAAEDATHAELGKDGGGSACQAARACAGKFGTTPIQLWAGG